jgi:Fe2+ transport system protein B
MFDDKFFEDWLDTQAQKVMEKVANGEGIAPEQMMILMLKAQTNHFAHLDVDLRNEMILLREDMDKRFEQAQIETAKRFEQVDKRFEQAQVETAKRFEQLTSRIDHFMIWSFATTVSVGGIVVAVIKFM